MMQFTNKYDSPLGGITLASDGESLTGVWFDGQKYFGYTLSPKRHGVVTLCKKNSKNAWFD